MSTPAQLGPCTSWIDPASVTCLTSTDDADLICAAASQLLYEWSGRLYPGICEVDARPCGVSDCFAGVSVAATRWNLAAWVPRYADDAAPLCGCVAYRQIPLAGYPVQEIVEVTIGADTLPESAYRLDGQRYLVRIDGGYWPSCQDLRATLGEDRTFGVSYTCGSNPPASGVLAAAELACWLAERSRLGECDLPASTTAVTRQGVTLQLDPGQQGAARSLPLVAAFLDSVNPARIRRRGAMWSPDVEPYAR